METVVQLETYKIQSGINDILNDILQHHAEINESFKEENRRAFYDSIVQKYQEEYDKICQAEEEVKYAQESNFQRQEKLLACDELKQLVSVKLMPTCNLPANVVEDFCLLQPDDFLKDKIRSSDFRFNYVSNDVIEKLDVCPCGTWSDDDESSKELKDLKIIKNQDNQSKIKSARINECFHDQVEPRLKPNTFKTVFVSDKSIVVFHNYKKNTLYKDIVKIRNVSQESTCFQIGLLPRNSKFTVIWRNKANRQRKIAPGMHYLLEILFKTKDHSDSEEYLTLKVENGKPCVIKLKSYRDCPILRATIGAADDTVCSRCSYDDSTTTPDQQSHRSSFDDLPEIYSSNESSETTTVESPKNILQDSVARRTFNCGVCFVGEEVTLPVQLENIGGVGKFIVLSESDWCSMNINDITTNNELYAPPFTVWPAYFVMEVESYFSLIISFLSNGYGLQVNKFLIISDNYGIQSFHVIGNSILFEESFISIDKKLMTCDYENESSRVSYFLDLGIGEVGEELCSTFTVSNKSNLELKYRWEKRDNENVYELEDYGVKFPLELMTVSPSNGTFHQCSSICFRVTARPENTSIPANLYHCKLRLFIEDIPFDAILEETQLKYQPAKYPQRKCKNPMDITIVDIQVQWQYY